MPVRIALGQFNASVGDITANVEAIRKLLQQAKSAGAGVVIFPEMCICGYPPEDLLHKEHFLDDTREAVEKLASEVSGITAVVGFAEMSDGRCFNSLAVLRDGGISGIYRKGILPNYGVFDEKRYFDAGTRPLVVEVGGLNIVLSICEDIWDLEWFDNFLAGVSSKDIIMNISASPFHMGKLQQRRQILGRCARHFDCPIGYCNSVGGQDELVFDGRSMFVDARGDVICQAEAFSEGMLVVDAQRSPEGEVTVKNVAGPSVVGYTDLGEIAETYEALVLGTGDYVRKNGFKRVIIGLSGGIDSSLVAAVAADAIGAENIVGVTMPSRFNSEETISDAERLAKNLGIEFHTIPIADTLDSFDKSLNEIDGWDDKGTAYENLQARIRGTILMSLSNQFGHMVITCGNKSETAVGYSTLYGDTAGGFAVIKDVPKTMVYKLSRYVNERHAREIIPITVIERLPSAELRDGQKDSDSLPDYDLLDGILRGYIEEDKSAEKIAEKGLDSGVVKRIIGLVDRNEYKRRQSPPGIKITPKAFGRDRRMPITNNYGK